MATDTVFIGIDPTAGGRLHTYAILNDRLKILKLGEVSFDSLIAVIKEYSSAVCAIDAPITNGKGLMADPGYRARLGLDPKAANYGNYRVCEYELRKRKIGLYNTPTDAEQAPRWVKEGWRLYGALRENGFVEYPRPGERRMFETFPHAGYAVILKRRPLSKTWVEGLLQRQLVLFEEGVDVPDPMITLEEWTRHKILTGELSRERLYNHDQLDALMAAYTAFMADREHEHVIAVGDPTEGQIVLPALALLDSY